MSPARSARCRHKSPWVFHRSNLEWDLEWCPWCGAIREGRYKKPWRIPEKIRKGSR